VLNLINDDFPIIQAQENNTA